MFVEEHKNTNISTFSDVFAKVQHKMYFESVTNLKLK